MFTLFPYLLYHADHLIRVMGLHRSAVMLFNKTRTVRTETISADGGYAVNKIVHLVSSHHLAHKHACIYRHIACPASKNGFESVVIPAFTAFYRYAADLSHAVDPAAAVNYDLTCIKHIITFPYLGENRIIKRNTSPVYKYTTLLSIFQRRFFTIFSD